MFNTFKRIISCLKKKKLGKCGKNVVLPYKTILHDPQYIYIDDNVSIGLNCSLETWHEYNGEPTGSIPALEISDNVSISQGCQLSCLKHIQIKSGTLLGTNVFITDNFHGCNTHDELYIPPRERLLYSKGDIFIGENVWIGRNVCIMPGVSIGDGAIVGANAVVTHDIPAYSVAVGIPAKVIKNLN